MQAVYPLSFMSQLNSFLYIRFFFKFSEEILKGGRGGEDWRFVSVTEVLIKIQVF